MIVWLVLKLEISYRVIISWRILISFRGCFDGYIFAWWNIWVSIMLFFWPEDTFLCKWQGRSVTHPLFSQPGFHNNLLTTGVCKKASRLSCKLTIFIREQQSEGWKKKCTKFENRNPYWSKVLRNLKQWSLVAKVLLIRTYYYYFGFVR
jgi:hypothetical protein